MRIHKVLVYFVLLATVLLLAIRATALADSSAPSMLDNYTTREHTTRAAHEVIASWYGSAFAGQLTTSGERFDPHRLTAASITVPLGSIVKVKNPSNGRSVMVRINDCGPYVVGRTLDLSLRAAQKIGIVRQGVARLTVTPIKIPEDADYDRCSR